jgi:hypothetical protein
MPFLWLAADDDPGPSSQRAYIERNAIALLSKFRRTEVFFTNFRDILKCDGCPRFRRDRSSLAWPPY